MRTAHKSLLALALMATLAGDRIDQPTPRPERTPDDVADRRAKNAAKRERRAARAKKESKP